MATRVTTIGDTIQDLTNTAIPNAPWSIKLVVPDGAQAIDNQGISIQPITVSGRANSSGVWSQVVIPPGDITPTGCYYQVFMNGVPYNSPSFAYSAIALVVSSWVASPAIDPTQLLMYLQGELLSNTFDTDDTVTYSLSDNCIWTAQGIILPKGKSYPVGTDSQGRAFAYFVPNSLLNPNNVPYIAAFPSGQSLFFTVPAAPTQWKGNWSSATTYVIGDVVNLSGTWYQCILGHTNHTPPNATYWIVWPGENILNPTNSHLSGLTGSSGFVLPSSALSHDPSIPALNGDPNQSPLSLHDDLVNMLSRLTRDGRARKYYLFNTHQ